MENKTLTKKEIILLFGILHYILAIFIMAVKIILPQSFLVQLHLTEETHAILLIYSIITGSILYAKS